MGTSQGSDTGTGLCPPAPPATCHVPSSPSPWLSHNIYSGPGNLAGATALSREPVIPLSPPSLMPVPTGAPPNCPSVPYQPQCLLSRAEPGFVPHTSYLPPNVPATVLGGQQDVPSCHQPPGTRHPPLGTARGTNCSAQRGQLGWGRKIWVQGGSLEWREEDFGRGRKIEVRKRFEQGITCGKWFSHHSKKKPSFLKHLSVAPSLGSEKGKTQQSLSRKNPRCSPWGFWCWGMRGAIPMSLCPHIPVSPSHRCCAHLEHSCL